MSEPVAPSQGQPTAQPPAEKPPAIYTQPPTPPSQAQATAAPTTQLTPEQQEFMNILNDLIMSAQELSYALAVVDQSIVEKHPELKDLLEAARSVVKNVWRFHKFVKTRVRGAR